MSTCIQSGVYARVGANTILADVCGWRTDWLTVCVCVCGWLCIERHLLMVKRHIALKGVRREWITGKVSLIGTHFHIHTRTHAAMQTNKTVGRSHTTKFCPIWQNNIYLPLNFPKIVEIAMNIWLGAVRWRWRIGQLIDCVNVFVLLLLHN